MTLNTHDYRLYLLTHLGLLLFAGLRKKVFPAHTDWDSFLEADQQTKAKCREKVYEDMSLIDDYLSAFSGVLTQEQVDVIEGFKKKIKSNFIILKCLARHAIFIDTNDNRFYAVHPLSDRFEEFFPRFPVYCHTVILPFKNIIIYDGFIQPSNVFIGPKMTIDMNENYKEAKRNGSIITRLS